MADEITVYDQLTPCPYLPARLARLPLRYPIGGSLSGAELDARLNEGDRRSGTYLYRVNCPACRACEAIRLDVNEFRPNQTQRRTWRKGNVALQAIAGPLKVDAKRVALFNAHRLGRGLSEHAIDEAGYADFLVESCCDTFEIQYRLATGSPSGTLIGVAVCDQGADSLSAVYSYYDPAYATFSPGVFSVLTQIEYCRASGLRYLYLGLYVAESPHMRYKARYLPHERLIQGRWRKFEESSESAKEKTDS